MQPEENAFFWQANGHILDILDGVFSLHHGVHFATRISRGQNIYLLQHNNITKFLLWQERADISRAECVAKASSDKKVNSFDIGKKLFRRKCVLLKVHRHDDRQ